MSDDGSGSSRSNLTQKRNKNGDHNQAPRGKLARFFGIGQKNSAEEEIMELVDDAEQEGSIDVRTKSLIENVFEFADLTAGEIMTHRTEIRAIEDNESLQDVTQIAIESGYSRIPVFHEDIDDITGVINVKDLLKFVYSDAPSEIKLTDIMRPVLYVPAPKVCSEIFAEMTAKKIQIAIVLDEYGGTAGLITMEDLVETIVGSIQDEYDNEEDDVVLLSEGHFIVEGSMSIEDLEELTGVDFTDSECDTVAGFILDALGYFPPEDEKPVIRVKNLSFSVLEIEERRILRVAVKKL